MGWFCPPDRCSFAESENRATDREEIELAGHPDPVGTREKEKQVKILKKEQKKGGEEIEKKEGNERVKSEGRKAAEEGNMKDLQQMWQLRLTYSAVQCRCLDMRVSAAGMDDDVVGRGSRVSGCRCSRVEPEFR